MTEERKTLKDIEWSNDPNVQELRQEAIKWIKELEEYKKMFKPGMTGLMYKCIDEKHEPQQYAADKFKEFFNIEESELE